jgi:EmrB/QacA subfamily drug resistance transporter
MLVLVICCFSLFIVGMDSTIVNVALPSIARDLHASVSGLQWTIDGYTLVLASLLMLSGATADRVGRRRVFQIGLVVFTVGSGLCSLAPGLGWLVAFRVVQAVGGSMLNPVAMSIITNTFTDQAERARALGAWGAAFALSMAVGPVLGGVLVDSVSWRGVFWVNIPVGIAAIALTARFVPESRAPRPRRPDPWGQLFLVVMLGSLTYAIIEGPGRGWRSAEILALFAVAAVIFAVFVAYEAHRTEPVLDPRFFRSVPFAGAVVTAISAFAALGGFLFLATLYLQDVRAMSALEAGLHMVPMAVVMAIGSFASSRVLARWGARLPMALAGAALTAGAALMTGLTTTSSLLAIVIPFAVFGLGSGMVNAPITQAAVSGMPVAQAGVASGIASTSRQIGTSLGVAITGSLLAGGLHGAPLPKGFVAASHADWLLLAACGAAVFVFALVTTTRWALGTADRTAAALEEAGPRTPVATRSLPRPLIQARGQARSLDSHFQTPARTDSRGRPWAAGVSGAFTGGEPGSNTSIACESPSRATALLTESAGGTSRTEARQISSASSHVSTNDTNSPADSSAQRCRAASTDCTGEVSSLCTSSRRFTMPSSSSVRCFRISCQNLGFVAALQNMR